MNPSRRRRRALLHGTLLAALCLAPSAGAARAPVPRRPDQALLVCNETSPASRTIAADYALKRGVKNILSVRCPDSALNAGNETITLADYTQLLETPIRNYLRAHTNIDFIVLTKGIPIRITGAAFGSCDEKSREPVTTRGHPSVDSFLSAMDYTNLPGALRISLAGSGAIGCAWSNRYWNAHEPFSHAKFGGYLVTRLDGYSVDDVKALTERSLIAERDISQIVAHGKVLLDVEPIFGLGDPATQPAPIESTNILAESAWSEFNADMRHAAELLALRNIPCELDLTTNFIGGRSNVLGYFSWGSNDEKAWERNDFYSPGAYLSLRFAPGALCDTAVSTSARTFLPTRGGQSLLVDLIAHGLTGGKGYTDEPLLQAIASPTIVFDRYTSGCTLAESFYAASHFVAWEDIVIGDPLCSPYLGQPQEAAPVRVFSADPPTLAASKSALAHGDTSLRPALESLLADANELLSRKPPSVMEKKQIPPSGDKHDYLSQAPYFWRDTNATATRYINRDGQRNPEAEKIADARNFAAVCNDARTLALAFYFSGDEKHAAKAAEFIRVWFLNPATRMNPNLKYGQGIPGGVEGRAAGLISARCLADLVDAVGLLAGSKAWTPGDQEQIRAWSEDYFQWLTTSKIGLDEDAASNNHGTFYDVQAVSLALFLGKTNFARSQLLAARDKRIARQIEPDGRMKRELARTLSFQYSLFNLRAEMQLATLAANVGVDLWHYHTPDGRGILKAAEFLAPYADPDRPWPFQSLRKPNRDELRELLQRAAAEFPESKIPNSLQFFRPEDLDDHPERLFLPMVIRSPTNGWKRLP